MNRTDSLIPARRDQSCKRIHPKPLQTWCGWRKIKFFVYPAKGHRTRVPGARFTSAFSAAAVQWSWDVLSHVCQSPRSSSGIQPVGTTTDPRLSTNSCEAVQSGISRSESLRKRTSLPLESRCFGLRSELCRKALLSPLSSTSGIISVAPASDTRPGAV